MTELTNIIRSKRIFFALLLYQPAESFRLFLPFMMQSMQCRMGVYVA
jgi:hypothetical protein